MKSTEIGDLELLFKIDPYITALRQFNFDRASRHGLIETERCALGISQRQIAKRMGITEQSYQQLRKRLKANPDSIKIATIRKAAAAMECDVAILLMPKDGTSILDLAQAEANARVSLAKKNREFCRQVGRDRGGRPPQY